MYYFTCLLEGVVPFKSERAIVGLDMNLNVHFLFWVITS